MATKERYVIIKTQFEGLHLWADAPEEVGYLRAQHRHIFHVEATISVTHEDRELEFIMVKHVLNNIINDYKQSKLNEAEGIQADVNLGSCEMMCEHIIQKLYEKYGARYYNVIVSEDDENGGQVVIDYRKESD